jgi:hypothetical protein
LVLASKPPTHRFVHAGAHADIIALGIGGVGSGPLLMAIQVSAGPGWGCLAAQTPTLALWGAVAAGGPEGRPLWRWCRKEGGGDSSGIVGWLRRASDQAPHCDEAATAGAPGRWSNPGTVAVVRARAIEGLN